MPRVYEYAISLQDRFLPILNRISSGYEKTISLWDRLVSRFKERFSGLGKVADQFRTRLNALAKPVKVKVDSSELDAANRKANGLRSLISGIGRVGRFAVGALGMASLGGAGILALGAGGMASAQRAQAARFQFASQMGGPTARLLESGVRSYAPERRDDLMNAGRYLYDAKIPQGNLMNTLKLLNNISTRTGLGNTNLAQMIGSVRANGKLVGGELDTLRNGGLNLNPALAQVLKVSERSIKRLQEKGLISPAAFEKALALQGGRLGNLYEQRRSTTAQGKEEYLRGRVAERVEALGERFLPVKMRILDFLIELVEKVAPAEKALSGLGKSVLNALRPIWEWFGRIGERLGLFTSQATPAEKIVAALTFVFDKLSVALNTVGRVLDWFLNSPVGNLIIGLKLLSSTFGLLGGAAALSSPIGAFVAGVAAMAAGLAYAYEKSELFRHSILDGVEGWKVFLSSIPTAWKLLTPGTMGQFYGFGKAMDQVADDNARKQITLDNYQRNFRSVDDRMRARSSLFKKILPKAEDPSGNTLGGGTFGGLSQAAGLNSTVGNSKSQSVTITMQSLVNHSEINVLNADEGVADLESKVLDALSRLLYSAGHLAAAR